MIQHHLSREQFTQALQALSGQVRLSLLYGKPAKARGRLTISLQDDLELYYRHAAVLVRNAPKNTVDALMRRSDLDIRRLIPALTTPRAPFAETSPLSSSDALATRHIIRYLRYAILDLQNTDPSVHNTLVTLYATSSRASSSTDDDEADFTNFLHLAPTDPDTGDPYYDLDYALRLCRSNGRVQACVLIYSKMKLYESSVDLALEHDDLELAKLSADEPEDDDMLRKKLWLKVARHVVGKKNDITT